MRINELKQSVDTTVSLRMKDGEIAKVKVNVVDEEYENIIAVVLETSCPEHHRAPCAVDTFAAEDIVSAELLQEGRRSRAKSELESATVRIHSESISVIVSTQTS